MSYEHFETILTVDVRSTESRRDTEYAVAGTGQPRLDWSDRDGRQWFTTTPYAHDVLKIAAQTVEDMPMDGITGDHPEKRQQAAEVIRAAMHLVKALAGDAACDGTLTDEVWSSRLADVIEAAS